MQVRVGEGLIMQVRVGEGLAIQVRGWLVGAEC